jgi:hypothetical protein
MHSKEHFLGKKYYAYSTGRWQAEAPHGMYLDSVYVPFLWASFNLHPVQNVPAFHTFFSVLLSALLN